MKRLLVARCCSEQSKNESKKQRDIKILLLKEFMRRMLLWKNKLESNGYEIEKNIPLFDVGFLLTDKKFKLSDIHSTDMIGKLYVTDIVLLNAYFNWKYFLNDVIKTTYGLHNPYNPYIELLKLGSGRIRPDKAGGLEVDYSISIPRRPMEQYLTEMPFWEDDLLLA
ncbi:MAG: hypothetical protein AAFO82_03465 [Bacteroidota bacterium]